MKTICYRIKKVRANTTYVDLPEEDLKFILRAAGSVLAYTAELSVHRAPQAKTLINWLNTPSDQLPFSTMFQTRNSPLSIIGGCINNTIYKGQFDFTLNQLKVLSKILNYVITELNDIEKRHNVDLHQNDSYEEFELIELK